MDQAKDSAKGLGMNVVRGIKWICDKVVSKLVQMRDAIREDLKGWLVCTAVLIITVVRSGVTYSFGVFVAPLEKEFQGNMAVKTWIGTLSFCISLSCAPVSVSFIRSLGPKGYRVGGLLGTAVLSVSCLGSSFVSGLEWLFFTHSLLYGIGSSLIYMASSLIIAEYFPERHKYHVLATSLLLCGYPVGSLVFNPINQWLIHAFAWRTALRFASGLTLVTGAICCWFFSSKETTDMERLASPPATPDEEPGGAVAKLVEKSKYFTIKEMKERPEIPLWYLGNCLSYLGFYTPFLHLAYYMEKKNLVKSQISMALIGLSFAECVAYVVASFMGDYLKDKLIFANICSAGALMVIHFAWPLVDFAFEVIMIISLALGTFLGLNIVYTYAASAEVTQLPMDVAWSLTNLWSGIGILGGPLFTGVVFDLHRSYAEVFNVVGAIYLVDFLVFAAIPIIQRRRARLQGSETLGPDEGFRRPSSAQKYNITTLPPTIEHAKDHRYGSIDSTAGMDVGNVKDSGINGGCGNGNFPFNQPTSQPDYHY